MSEIKMREERKEITDRSLGHPSFISRKRKKRLARSHLRHNREFQKV